MAPASVPVQHKPTNHPTIATTATLFAPLATEQIQTTAYPALETYIYTIIPA